MKIIFFGTTIFSVESLKKLIENKYEVLSVVCPVDKIYNRGLKTKFCEVKQYAIEKKHLILEKLLSNDLEGYATDVWTTEPPLAKDKLNLYWNI